MPKNPGRRFRQWENDYGYARNQVGWSKFPEDERKHLSEGYYGNNRYFGNERKENYTYSNKNSYNQPYACGETIYYQQGRDEVWYANNYYGRSDNNYRNRRQKPYNANKRGYQNRNNTYNKENEAGNSKKASEKIIAKPIQDPQEKLLLALNKTAQAVNPRNNLPKIAHTSPTKGKTLNAKNTEISKSLSNKEVVSNKPSQDLVDKIVEKTVQKPQELSNFPSKDQEASSNLNEPEKNIEKEVTPKKAAKLDIHRFIEENEVSFKTMKYLIKLDERREEYSRNNDNNVLGPEYDTATVKCVRLFQTREEMIHNAKRTRIYEAARKEILKNGVPEGTPRTPEVAAATSRWIDEFYKPWKLEISRIFFHCLEDPDESDIDEEKDHEILDDC